MRKIMIVGAGNGGKFTLNWVGSEKVNCFVDSDEKKIGKFIECKKVISYKEAAALQYDFDIVICPTKYECEIEEALKANGIQRYFFARIELLKEIFDKSNGPKRRIILLNSHDGINVGDYAIAEAEKVFFSRYLGEYELVEIPQNLCANNMSEIKKYLHKSDCIVISGGGYLGSLWLPYGENTVREAIEELSEYRIIILPQTLFFEDNEFGKTEKRKSVEIYNAHRNLTICLRDEQSFLLAKSIFTSNVKCLQMPDMVTLLNYSDANAKREGVLFCIREDKESIFDKKNISRLEAMFENKNISVDSMSMLLKNEISFDEREEQVQEKIRYIKSHRLVITDRLHCMLLSMISGTPCIAFDNISGKVSGVFRWVQENTYVRCVQNIEEVESIWEQLYLLNDLHYNDNGVKAHFEELGRIINGKRNV